MNNNLRHITVRHSLTKTRPKWGSHV